jgi:hypothetical protein
MTKTLRDCLTHAGISLASIAFIAWVIPTFTPPYPGYGVSAALLPYVTACIILLLSCSSLGYNLFIFYKEKKQTSLPREKYCEDDKVHLLYLIYFIIPCLLLMPAMQLIGFLPGGIIFMMYIQYRCGQKNHVQAILVSVATVGFVYCIMQYGLGVPLP